jgi:NADPH-dependent glutamate synthase beta subunit-like oxidoreductase
VPIEGSETIIELDMLISAISQQADLSFLEKEPEKDKIAITRWSTFENDEETLLCSQPWLFTAGDSTTGPSLVVSAIGGGRRAARSIHQFLTGDRKRFSGSRDHLHWYHGWAAAGAKVRGRQ